MMRRSFYSTAVSRVDPVRFGRQFIGRADLKAVDLEYISAAAVRARAHVAGTVDQSCASGCRSARYSAMLGGLCITSSPCLSTGTRPLDDGVRMLAVRSSV